MEEDHQVRPRDHESSCSAMLPEKHRKWLDMNASPLFWRVWFEDMRKIPGEHVVLWLTLDGVTIAIGGVVRHAA